jgi:hypothetical protein
LPNRIGHVYATDLYDEKI